MDNLKWTISLTNSLFNEGDFHTFYITPFVVVFVQLYMGGLYLSVLWELKNNLQIRQMYMFLPVC